MQMGRCCMCTPPPVLPGVITRFIYPSFPADYEGIGDTAWQFGTTGNATENCNVAYVELYTPSQRLTSATIIMEPVRFSIYSPASDGGTFDYWAASGISGFTQIRQYLYESSAVLTCPISPTLIPSGSHAEFSDGEFSISPSQSGLMPTRALTTEPNLYSGNNPVGGISLVAFGHRINGSLVGSVKTSPFTAADVRCAYTIGDTYELDLWWQRTYTPNIASPDTPMTMRNFYPLSRVSNSSKKPPELTRIGASTIYAIGFANVNFTPAFSALTHTYSISISGHTGWTLLGGSNGPITIQDYADLWSGGVSQAGATLSALAGQPVSKIAIAWNAEVVYAIVTRQSKQYYYRSTTASATYRSATTSTDYGGVNHALYGLFNATGTTVFEYIDWNIGVSVSNVSSFPRGVYSNAALPTKPADLPQTITLTRIPRPTTGSTTYDSGSGNFTVPAGKTILQIEGWGGGGGGGAGGAGGGSNGGSGGGGGGYFRKTIAVSPGDLIAYSVGSGGAGGVDGVTDVGSDGGNTTVSGGTYTANGGSGGDYGDNDPTVAASGGTASGGDTNTTGSASLAVTISDDGSAGGAGGGTDGGAGGSGGIQSGAEAQVGTGPGGGGGGGAKSARPGGAGANGRVKFSY